MCFWNQDHLILCICKDIPFAWIGIFLSLLCIWCIQGVRLCVFLMHITRFAQFFDKFCTNLESWNIANIVWLSYQIAKYRVISCGSKKRYRCGVIASVIFSMAYFYGILIPIAGILIASAGILIAGIIIIDVLNIGILNSAPIRARAALQIEGKLGRKLVANCCRCQSR